MSRITRIVNALTGAASDDKIVAMLAQMSHEELCRLREFGIMVQELAREGIDELSLPEQLRPDWRTRRDALGLRLVENEGNTTPGILIDGADLPAFLRAFGCDEGDLPDGERCRIVAEQPNELLEQVQFVEVPDAECEYLPGEGLPSIIGRDPGDETDRRD